MSILIKGMEMPTSCQKCPLKHRGFNGSETVHYCYAICKEVSDDGEIDAACPLVQIQQHGRLIDADAFKKYFSDGFETVKPYLHDKYLRLAEEITESLLIDVDESPTVIPADGKDINVTTREEEEGE